jgi:hypothetical protein
MPGALSAEELRVAITNTLYWVKAYELDAVCEGLGLAPAGPSENPYDSKKIYIRQRLLRLTMPDLMELGRRVADEYDDDELRQTLARAGAHTPDGQIKNLIFAADGPKPRIVLRDAVENVIEIVENEQFCLVYDRPLIRGLTWGELTDWWIATHGAASDSRLECGRALFERLSASLSPDSPGERLLLRTYAKRYGSEASDDLPALLPQIYLHYDPYTRRELGRRGDLVRQRMDFLLLPADGSRIVLEVDGAQHYSHEGKPRPQLYAEMVREDRELRLAGYEIYRFGGAELVDEAAAGRMLDAFFDRLLAKHTS